MSLVTTSQYGHTELFRCIFEKDVERALTLIENNTDVDKTDIHGFSPLMYALRKRLFEVTKRLIGKGSDVNIQNKNKETALHLIVKGRFRKPKRKDDWINFLDLLLEAKADVNLTDDRGFSPLMWAVKHGQVEMVERLIKAGADINVYNNRGEWCLDIAVKSSSPNTGILELLLSNGAKVNVKDLKQFTPLMWAVKNNNYDMVEMLIKVGAEVNFFNQYFDTCLHIAVKSQKPNMQAIECLLANKADVNIVDWEQKTPLVRAIESVIEDKLVKTEIAMKLINHGSDVNFVNLSGKTTLMLASEKDLENLVQPLIEKRCNVNAVDGENKTALWFAFQHRSIKILIMLLENDANPNKPILEEFQKIYVFDFHSIASANMLTALIKYGLYTDALPYHDTYPGLLCYLLMETKYVFDDITYLFDILFLSGSCTQKQLLLLLKDPQMEENFQSDCKKREWMITKCSQPLTLKEMSRIQVLKNRKENIISNFVKELPIETSLREYLKFSEFTIDDRNITMEFFLACMMQDLKQCVFSKDSPTFEQINKLDDTPVSLRSFWEKHVS